MRTVAGWVRSLVCKVRRVNAARWVLVVTKGSAATAELLGTVALKATVESEDLLVIEELKAILDRRVHKESAAQPAHKESAA